MKAQRLSLTLGSIALLSLALLLTLWPQRAPTSLGAPLEAPPQGNWRTYANGDAVQAFALEGETLWAGTRWGGAVRWDLPTGRYTQYLYPQTGLACNDVRDVLVGGGGKVWFATCRGLSVLAPDGTWQTYTVANTGGGLPSDNVTALALDPAGYLWVGTGQTWEEEGFTGGGLGRWEWATGEWRSFLPPTSPAVTDVAVDRQGRVWVGTQPAWTWVAPSDGGDGHWARRGGGLAVWDGNTWQSYTAANDFADSILTVKVDPAGNVWVGTEGAGAFVRTGERWVHFRPSDGLADGYVQAIGFAPGGEIWFATRKFNGHGTGVSVLDPGVDLADKSDDIWRHYRVEDGLPADLVWAMASDGQRLWLGTGSPEGDGFGIGQWAPETGFRPPLLTRPTSLAGNHITAIAQAPDGTLWIGTRHRGVSALSPDGRTWTTYTAESTDDDGHAPWTGLRGNSVSSIAIDAAGRVWIGTRETVYNTRLRGFEDGGLSLFDPATGRWTNFTQRNTDDDGRSPWSGLRSNDVSAVAVDWAGRVWVGSGNLRSFTGAGISVLSFGTDLFDRSDDTWEHYDVFDGVPSNNVTAIAVDVERREIWVTAAPYWTNGVRLGGGVGRFDGVHWTTYGTESGLVAAEGDLRSIALAPEDGVWVGGWTYQGSFHWPSGTGVDAVVNRFDGRVWQVAGLFEDDGYVAALAVDAEGNLWAGTSKDGLGAAPATGGIKRLTSAGWTSVTTATSGVVADEIQALLATSNGDVWVGSLERGLSRFGPHVPPPPTPVLPPPTATPTQEPTVVIARARRVWLPLLLVNHHGVWVPPTRTPTPSLTVTPLPGPTATPTLTATPSREMPTFTPTATATPPIPSPTPTATRAAPTSTPTPTPKPAPLGEWTAVSDLPPVDLYDVFFVNADAGWAVGAHGTVLHSTDGGATWVVQASGTVERLRSVFFVDRAHGWAVGARGTIIYTTDGGQTWVRQPSPVDDEAFVAVEMQGMTDGWIVGDEGVVLRWNGDRWLLQARTSYAFTDFQLLDSDHGWATTAEGAATGRVVELAAGRWSVVGTFQPLYGLHIPASGAGWAVGDRGTAVRQMQGRWEYVSRPPVGGLALRAVYSPDGVRAWAVGDQGLIFYFDGMRWQNRSNPAVTRQTLYAIHMTPDGRRGWIAGAAGPEGGTLLRYDVERVANSPYTASSVVP